MSVAYVLKSYPRYSETFIVNEIIAHENAGLEVFIYSLMPPRDTHFQDIISRVRAPVTYLTYKVKQAERFWETQAEVSRIFPNLWNALSENPGVGVHEVMQAMELSINIAKHNIEHIHAHFASVATTVARLASAITGVPYTFTAHAKDIFHQDNDYVTLKRKFADAAHAITISDFNMAYLQYDLEIPTSSLARIYNGLDTKDFPYTPPTDRKPVIVAVGRLVEKKGFANLIDACKILSEKGVVFRCKIVGTGDFEKALRDQIERLDLEAVVEMLGSRPQAEIKRLLTDAAVFTAPCVVGQDGDRDGLPTVLLEAMALGTPCISTDVTGIPEVLIHEETGLMVQQNNAADLAAAMERILSAPELGVAMAEKARDLIELNFDIEKNAARIRTLFIEFNGRGVESPKVPR